MTDRKQTIDEKRRSENPALRDVEPGSDADETPPPEVRKPRNPESREDEPVRKE